MKDELAVLLEVFGPDPVPTSQAREKARTALRQHMDGRPITVAPRPAVRRWPIRVAVLAAAAVVAVAGLIVVENIGGDAGGLPFPTPANAAEVLQNAAWAASQKPWQDPRPDQFMYNETSELRNDAAYERDHPNDPVLPGHAAIRVFQSWKRIDGKIHADTDTGQLQVHEQGVEWSWDQLNYDELKRLTTPEKVLAWDRADKNFGVDLDRLIGQYVLPPDVEAAFFQALARGNNVTLDPAAVNVDGRSAIGLSRVIEGYISQQLLFDPQTYALIGEREVVIAEHSDVDELGGTHTHQPGTIFRQVIYTKAIIVDHPGDTA